MKIIKLLNYKTLLTIFSFNIIISFQLLGFEEIKKEKLISIENNYKWNNLNWNKQNYKLFIYNNHTLEDSVIYYTAKNDAFKISNLTINKYDNNKNKVEKVEATWYDYNSKWEYKSKSIFQYDSLNRLVKEELYKWMNDWPSDNWQLSLIYENSYNTSSLLTEITMSRVDSQKKDTLPEYKYNFYYDDKNNRIQMVESVWVETTKTWLNKSDIRYIYEYGSNNEINKATFISIVNKNDTIFKNRETYQYDNKQIKSIVYETYVDSILAFINEVKDEYFNNNNLQDSIIKYIWFNTNWEKYTKKEFIYDITNSIDDKHEIENKLRIIPNPAGEYIEISKLSEGFKPSEGYIRIYNILGECVLSARANGSSPLHINVSSFPSGIYFVHLSNWTRSFLKIE